MSQHVIDSSLPGKGSDPGAGRQHGPDQEAPAGSQATEVGSRLLERLCPTCDSPAPAAPEVTSRRRGEDLSWDELRPYWDHFFKEKVFFSYSRCPQCGLLYCPRFFDHATLEALYTQTQHEMTGVPVEALQRTQAGYFRVLKRHSPLRGDFLEVGPDIGLFTALCAQEGQFDRYWMFEPSQAAHAPLEARLAGKDFSIHTDMFSFRVIPEHSVAVAVMIHVLDHLLDPKETLEELRSRLADGAIVLIVTHDESSLLARVFQNRWPPYCLAHPQLYRPRSMRAFLEAAGYRTLEISKTYNHFPFTYLLRHLLAAVGLGKIRVPSLSAPQVALKLGNIITIATPDRGSVATEQAHSAS